MLRQRLQSALLCLVAAAYAPGCYADSVSVPEPTLTTPGAFIAVPFEPVLPDGVAGAAGGGAEGGGADLPPGTAGAGGAAMSSELFRMIRVVAVFDVTSDFAIFHFPYGLVESIEEAREAAQARPSGPPPPVSITSLGRLESLDAVVVGYRSLTEEEQDSIR
ncbi:MAG TPA: hypothetical protein VFU02_20690 [Polyangiaceae bacterium]|nr:hypothetical protein [Polyangiaceae bacterium]